MGFNVLDTLSKLAVESGFAGFFAAGGWQNLVSRASSRCC